MAETLESVTILARHRIAPSSTYHEQSLPATFFDMAWLHFHPIQRILFYEFPCSKAQFLENIVPNFTNSLAQTLKHFLPLARNLIYPMKSKTMTEFRYVPGVGNFGQFIL